jgi:hypothetical protein
VQAVPWEIELTHRELTLLQTNSGVAGRPEQVCMRERKRLDWMAPEGKNRFS